MIKPYPISEHPTREIFEKPIEVNFRSQMMDRPSYLPRYIEEEY